MSAAAAAQGQGQQVDITTLPLPQLQQVKKQLDSEISHLTTSYSSLRQAQQKFKDCITSINAGVRPPSAEKKQLLVPLTTSLYVPGTLATSDTVLVDVGTGFYVEKSCDDAVGFYEGKVKELGENVKGLEEVVGKKQGSLRLVEEVMRGKMLQQQQQQQQGGGQQGQGR
ncbi:Prefoldin alpha subunit [Myriangium duriaei CBS 260.36]|uniref:Prefoldin alpha subunit n=1 Tax=Myriangium duriaei CBS 260.36 TaxID=1168546 RepID=A0A9P4J2W0_9PEZI|nr:Prefoldin alpha subunit [Myriangium duriaei CBS 260.36]